MNQKLKGPFYEKIYEYHTNIDLPLYIYSYRFW
jgi:hypothetical protein